MMIGPLGEASNKAHLVFTLNINDDDTDTPIDIAGAAITIAVRDPDTKAIIFTVEVDSGVEISESVTGRALVTFSSDQMRGLCAKTYDVGGVMTLENIDYQLLIGKLPVLDGIVA